MKNILVLEADYEDLGCLYEVIAPEMPWDNIYDKYIIYTQLLNKEHKVYKASQRSGLREYLVPKPVSPPKPLNILDFAKENGYIKDYIKLEPQ